MSIPSAETQSLPTENLLATVLTPTERINHQQKKNTYTSN